MRHGKDALALTLALTPDPWPLARRGMMLIRAVFNVLEGLSQQA
jgi:hypothetical protein